MAVLTLWDLGEKGAISKNVAWGLLEHTIAIFWALCALAHTVRACSTCLCTNLEPAKSLAKLLQFGHIAIKFSSCVYNLTNLFQGESN